MTQNNPQAVGSRPARLPCRDKADPFSAYHQHQRLQVGSTGSIYSDKYLVNVTSRCMTSSAVYQVSQGRTEETTFQFDSETTIEAYTKIQNAIDRLFHSHNALLYGMTELDCFYVVWVNRYASVVISRELWQFFILLSPSSKQLEFCRVNTHQFC